MLFSILTVVDEEKREGVPGDERRATSPPLLVSLGMSDLVSEPEESTRVVAAVAEATRKGSRNSLMMAVFL
jgi:hypothetical protein